MRSSCTDILGFSYHTKSPPAPGTPPPWTSSSSLPMRELMHSDERGTPLFAAQNTNCCVPAGRMYGNGCGASRHSSSPGNETAYRLPSGPRRVAIPNMLCRIWRREAGTQNTGCVE
eukprot:scaffold30730_cov31-Tisochrysis_lutea.AAC.1